LYKIELSFSQEFGTKVFTGWVEVRNLNGADPRQNRAKICNECQYAAHMHVLGEAYPTKKAKFCLLFSI